MKRVNSDSVVWTAVAAFAAAFLLSFTWSGVVLACATDWCLNQITQDTQLSAGGTCAPGGYTAVQAGWSSTWCSDNTDILNDGVVWEYDKLIQVDPDTESQSTLQTTSTCYSDVSCGQNKCCGGSGTSNYVQNGTALFANPCPPCKNSNGHYYIYYVKHIIAWDADTTPHCTDIASGTNTVSSSEVQASATVCTQ